MSTILHKTAIRSFALGIITGSFITSGAILLATPAKAAPVDELATAVCSALDNNPTVDEVSSLITIFVENGASPYQAGEFIGGAVANYCTRNIPVLQKFIDVYGPKNGNSKLGGKLT